MPTSFLDDPICVLYKVNSVQEACAKCFAVHLLKFEILQTTWRNKTKNIKMLNLLVKNWKLRVWCSLFQFFHVIWKISNFNMWTAKHLAQASCTELTLPQETWIKKNAPSKIISTRCQRPSRTFQDKMPRVSPLERNPRSPPESINQHAKASLQG